MIKAWLGVKGSFGMPDADDRRSQRHTHNPSIDHLYWAGHKLVFVMCPSHQLKNMVNGLHSSRQDGTKTFCTPQGFSFGWQAIFDLYEQERFRQEIGQPRDVSRLRANYVWRDTWTKLNVYPAKIMQQDHVLTELNGYCSKPVTPPDVANLHATLAYLTACSKIFEPTRTHPATWTSPGKL